MASLVSSLVACSFSVDYGTSDAGCRVSDCPTDAAVADAEPSGAADRDTSPLFACSGQSLMNDPFVDASSWFTSAEGVVLSFMGDAATMEHAGAGTGNLYSKSGVPISDTLLVSGVAVPADLTNTYVSFGVAQNAPGDLVEFGINAVGLHVMSHAGGIEEELATVTYDPELHRYLRLRASGATIWFETSADGIEWDELASSERDATAEYHVNLGVYIFGDSPNGTTVFSDLAWCDEGT